MGPALDKTKMSVWLFYMHVLMARFGKALEQWMQLLHCKQQQLVESASIYFGFPMKILVRVSSLTKIVAGGNIAFLTAIYRKIQIHLKEN